MAISSKEYRSYMAYVDSTNGHCHRLLVGSLESKDDDDNDDEGGSNILSPHRRYAAHTSGAAIVAVDNVGKDDSDVNLSITCEHLEHLCKAFVVD